MTSLKFVPVAVLCAALSAPPAFAQEATLFPGDPGYAQMVSRTEGIARLDAALVVGQRDVLTRAQVLAELAQARLEGAFTRLAEWFMDAVQTDPSRTHEMALAEVAQARLDGTFDRSGEHWIGHDHGGRDPMIAREAAAPRVLAIAR